MHVELLLATPTAAPRALVSVEVSRHRMLYGSPVIGRLNKDDDYMTKDG